MHRSSTVGGPVVTVAVLGLVLAGCSTSRHAALEQLLSGTSWPPEAAVTAPGLDLEQLASAIHLQVDSVRMSHGLSRLEWSPIVAEVAKRHSLDMAETPFFGHTSPSGQAPADRARAMNLPTRVRSGSYVVEGLGENLFLTHYYRAYTVRSSDSGVSSYSFEWKTLDGLAREAVSMWMGSPSHRSNLLSPIYRSIGIGATRTSHETVLVTCNFLASSVSTFAAR